MIKDVKNIPNNKKHELSKLQEFRNGVIKYSEKIRASENYMENLSKLSQYIKEKVNTSEGKIFSNDNEKLQEVLKNACKGDVLRVDVIIHINDFAQKIDEHVKKESYSVAEKFLEGAQTREEITERVAYLVRGMVNTHF